MDGGSNAGSGDKEAPPNILGLEIVRASSQW